jgi:copper chaperone CopZ
MTCDGCVKDVSDTLYKLEGISKVEADLKTQLVSIEGTGTGCLGNVFACISLQRLDELDILWENTLG